MALNLFNLIAKITLDSADYESGLNKSEKSASSFAQKASKAFKGVATAVTVVTAAVTAATTAIITLTTKTVAYGDTIDKMSQKLGMSAESYQSWALAAQLAGTDVSTLQMGIRQLNTFVDNLTDKSSDASKALKTLGINASNFSAMSTEQQLSTIVNALQGVDDATTKASLAQEVFGSRVYQELLPLLNQEQGSVDELTKQFKEMGLIISDDVVSASANLNDQITLMTTAFKSAGTTMMSKFYPQIEQIVSGITDLISGTNDTAINNIIDGILGIIDKIPNIVPAIVEFVEKLLLIIVDVIPDLVGSLGEIITALITGLLQLDWVKLVTKIIETIMELAATTLPNFVYSLLDNLMKIFTTGNGLKMLGKLGVGIAEIFVNSFITGFESSLNLVINAINLLMDGLSQLWTWAGIPEIPDIPTISIPRVSFFADGGMFDDLMNGYGTAYAVTGEKGAEIVAQGSKGTGVTNVDEFYEAMLKALYAIFGNGVTLRMGDKDIKAYIIQTVNSSLKSQGRQTLNAVTGY